MSRDSAFRLDARNAELAGNRVDKLFDFANITANLVAYFSLSLNFLLDNFKDAKVLLSELLCLILFVIDLLKLHGQTLNVKSELLNNSSLLFHLAFFSLCRSLMLSHFIVQIFNPSEECRFLRICIFDFMKFVAQLPLDFLKNCVFLHNHSLSISQVSRKISDSHFPLLGLSFNLCVIIVPHFNHLAL